MQSFWRWPPWAMSVLTSHMIPTDPDPAPGLSAAAASGASGSAPQLLKAGAQGACVAAIDMDCFYAQCEDVGWGRVGGVGGLPECKFDAFEASSLASRDPFGAEQFCLGAWRSQAGFLEQVLSQAAEKGAEQVNPQRVQFFHLLKNMFCFFGWL